MKPATSYPNSLTLRHVDLWTHEGVLENQKIVIERGITQSVVTDTESSQPRAAIIPLGVDSQVHLRVPGQTQKEDVKTGLSAALYGGYGAFLTMPNTNPVIDCVEVVEQANRLIEEQSRALGVEVKISAAITLGQKGKELVDFKALTDAGVVAFTDDGIGVASDNLMEEAFRAAAEVNLPLLQHAETPGHGGVLAPGPVQKSLGLQPYADAPEVDMVRRDIEALRKHPKGRYHVLHVSSRHTLDWVKRAKDEGLNVTAEVSPHHLYFSTEDIDAENSAFKMNPPIRSPEDREALQAALSSGLIDWVATDHAPHEASAKPLNFDKAAFGTLGLETALGTLLALQQRGKLSASRLVEVFSRAPAKFLGFDDSWGQIKEGKPFRAVALDLSWPDREVKAERLHSLSRNSCFLGTKLPGLEVAHFNGAGMHLLLESHAANWIEGLNP